MIHLIYISSVTSWPTENDLIEILGQARARNIKQNVTGMDFPGFARHLKAL